MNPQRVDAALALVSPAAGATLPGFAVDLNLTAFVDLSLEDVVITPIPRAAGAEIARAPSGPTLTGRVLDAQSQASVARADVVVDVGGQSEQGYANAQGIYLLPVTTGTLTGSIAASGYTGATLSGTTTGGQTRMADALLTTSGPAVETFPMTFVREESGQWLVVEY